MADKLSIITYALSKKFASGLALGGYTSVTAVENQVKFKMHDGTDVVVTLPLPKDGVGIKAIEIVNGELICTMTDNTKINAGAFPSGALTEQLVVSNEVGSATKGKIYNVGTNFETIIRDILIKEEAPLMTLTVTPTDVLYNVVTDKVSKITMNAQVTKKTYDLSKIEWYVNGVLKDTTTINSNGTYSKEITFTPPTNSDFILKAIVYDSKDTPLTTTKSQTIKFVGKSYYGYVDSSIGEPTEAQVKSLQKDVLKDVKKLVYSNITFDYNKVVYAYPKSFGELTSIKDKINNLSYKDSFTKTEIKVDNIDYLVYTQNDASASSNVELTFE